jgi:2,3-bisphosphoglycerate-independent phosphoglycerate mutase
MKYIVLLGDGMADYPVDELGGQTPLMAAHTPHMDWLAQRGRCGLVRSVPAGFPPGSEIANLSILGYDPARYYTGRGPLEAPSVGVDLEPEDVAFRCNLVTLEALGGHVIMKDYSAGHITTNEASVLMKALDEHLGNSVFRFYPGVSYRHLLVWKGGRDDTRTTPPHDIIERDIGNHLPAGDGAYELLQLITDAQIFLKTHPVNEKRRRNSSPEANSIWPWGQGRAPRMPTFGEKFGLTGSVISAVDLIKGIGMYAGLEIVDVPGATGYLDTNYRGKAQHGVEALTRGDFVYIHVEAPDEAGHSGDVQAKIQAIEAFDEYVVGTVREGIKGLQEYRLMVLPDHPTPIALRTHVNDPVPFAIYSPREEVAPTASSFDEHEMMKSGILIEEGHTLIERFIRGW